MSRIITRCCTTRCAVFVLAAYLMFPQAGMAQPEPPAPAASAASVSTEDLLASIDAMSGTSDAELLLRLKLKTEALARIATEDSPPSSARSLALCASALKDAEKAYGGSNIRLVPVLRLVAKVQLRFKRSTEALAALTRAQTLSKSALGADDPANRFILADLAEAYTQAQRPRLAQAAGDRARYLGQIAAASIEGGATLGSNTASNAAAPYQIVPVFFQTTRVRTGSRDPLAFFGSTRDDTSHYGVSYVSVPKSREIGTIPHPSVFRLDFSKDPSRHVILKEITPLGSQRDFWKSIQGRMLASARKETLIYVHGFNQSFQDGMETAATLAADLEIDGSVLSFSWPSRNNLLLYAADIDEATSRHNRTALLDLLTHVSAETGAQHVYVVAHSMGNRLLLEALSLMQAGPAGPPIDHLIFASPDMESADFSKTVGNLGALSRRMTLYTAAGDLALTLSDTLRGVTGSRKARAGERDGGVRSTDKLDVVDTSNAKADLLGHANFAYLAKDDLRALVWFGLSAERRCVLVSARTAGWRYDPSEPCSSDAFSLASLYLRRFANTDQALSKLAAETDSLSRAASQILRTMIAKQ